MTLAGKLELARSRWTLAGVDPIAETATSWVFKTETEGQPAALKVLKPYGADEIRGADLLAWYDGIGAARLLGTHEGMILMEWLDGEPLGDIARSGGDDEATRILCEVAISLHRPRRGPIPDLEPLEQRFKPLLSANLGKWPSTHRHHFRRAAVMAEHLLATTTNRIPLHADFHHDNVVSSARGWLAIDPKGLVGDPTYEFANVFRNPLGGEAFVAQPERIDRTATHIAESLGIDRMRILRWAAAHSALSACWDRAAGNAVDWDLTMLPLLLSAVDRARA